MAAVRAKNTKPETLVRRLAHALGYRFRLHRRDLPGKPDLVFPKRRAIVFVHGCFWHAHSCSKGTKRPIANRDWWEEKLTNNRARDESVIKALENAGWRVLIIWECNIRNTEILSDELRGFLGG